MIPMVDLRRQYLQRKQVLSLLMFPEITEEEIRRISDVINGSA